MNARRGACPALTVPMRTGDGLLVRLNTVAGGFSSTQLMRLCESAQRHGNGVVEVTARGSFQIRGLTETSAPLLATEVDALGIAVRTGVPVETGPLAGLDPDEIADPRPLAARIRAAVAEAGLSTRLGPKVSVVVDGGGCSGVEDVSSDVRLTARRAGDGRSAATVWQVALAGDAATAMPVARFDEYKAAAAVLALLHTIAELGVEARARDLSAECVSQIIQAAEGGHSDFAPRGPATPMPPEVPHIERSMCRADTSAFTPLPLTDSRHAISIALPFGSTEAALLIQLVRAAEGLDIAEIRLAPQRRLIFIAPTETAYLGLRQQAAALGFISDPRDPRLSISACPGTPACASGHLAARDIAHAVAVGAGDTLDGSLPIHISGCAKGCARHSEADLTLVGGENGAALVVGGTAVSRPVAYASTEQAARRLGATLALVGQSRRSGETSADTAARLGAARLAAAFEQG